MTIAEMVTLLTEANEKAKALNARLEKDIAEIEASIAEIEASIAEVEARLAK